MIRIEHIAVWTENLARLVEFYATYFDATAGAKYTNSAKGYEKLPPWSWRNSIAVLNGWV
jgi:catechol 2,3-dioxygenase-like lactoylglutathione lyase family enzyme